MEKNNNPTTKNTPINDRNWLKPAIFLFTKLFIWIALPIFAAILVGNWLDEKYGNGQYWFFICIGIAFLVTVAGLGKSALNAYGEIDSFSKK